MVLLPGDADRHFVGRVPLAQPQVVELGLAGFG